MHWATKYIGMPYEAGARGPNKVDCWGLLYLAYRNDFATELPLYPGMDFTSASVTTQLIAQEVIRSWESIATPVEGCAVAMSLSNIVHHVGLYTGADGGKVIHCWEELPVIADTLRGITMRGVRNVLYYRHTSWQP